MHYALDVENNAIEKSKESGKIENFLIAASRASAVRCSIIYNTRLYNFYDDRSLMKEIVAAEYTFVDYSVCKNYKFSYNVESTNLIPWVYKLHNSKALAIIEYHFTDSYKRQFVTSFTYKINKDSYNAIFNVAKTMAIK